MCNDCFSSPLTSEEQKDEYVQNFQLNSDPRYQKGLWPARWFIPSERERRTGGACYRYFGAAWLRAQLKKFSCYPRTICGTQRHSSERERALILTVPLTIKYELGHLWGGVIHFTIVTRLNRAQLYAAIEEIQSSPETKTDEEDPGKVAVPSQIEQLNSSKFFVIHNATLQFDVFTLKKSNCTQGNLCDLRNPTRGDCACWFQRTRSRSDAHYIIRADITVNYLVRNVTVPRTDQLPTVHGWTSQHFTQFVFDGKLPLNPLQQESDSQITRLLRWKLRELIDYVNTSPNVPEETRGWTVIGWYHRGTKTDGATAANADDKVATQMDDSTMHIVRIEPTRVTKEQLNAAGLLLPVSVLGENTDIRQVRQQNLDARNNRANP